MRNQLVPSLEYLDQAKEVMIRVVLFKVRVLLGIQQGLSER